MKKIALLLPILALSLTGCDNNEVGDVSLGLFTTKDIKVNILVDPVVTGVTCHVASIEANLDLSDPSDSAISCRQTGEITPEMINKIDKSHSGEVVFKKSKSIFFKTMKIRRIFDKNSQTLMYISYSTKETSGSYKHSLSTVPLWGTLAYQHAANTHSKEVSTSTSPTSNTAIDTTATPEQSAEHTTTVGEAAGKNEELVF